MRKTKTNNPTTHRQSLITLWSLTCPLSTYFLTQRGKKILLYLRINIMLCWLLGLIKPKHSWKIKRLMRPDSGIMMSLRFNNGTGNQLSDIRSELLSKMKALSAFRSGSEQSQGTWRIKCSNWGLLTREVGALQGRELLREHFCSAGWSR